MLITMMFSAVTKKSRTLSSFSYSANKQVCRSWESTQPGSQPKLSQQRSGLNHTKYSNIQRSENKLNITNKAQLIKVSFLTNFSKDKLSKLFKLHDLCTSF